MFPGRLRGKVATAAPRRPPPVCSGAASAAHKEAPRLTRSGLDTRRSAAESLGDRAFVPRSHIKGEE